MTRDERRKRLAEVYRSIAAELDHHFANGSEWLHFEPDGSDSPADVVKLRLAVLEREVDRATKRADAIERGPKRPYPFA